MTRPAEDLVPPEHTARPGRKWTWPKHLGKMRTSTVVLILAFLATALLRGFFVDQEESNAQQGGTVVAPVETSPELAPAPAPTTTPHATTTPTTTATTPPPSSQATSPEGAGTGTTATTSPLIVLPPELVPSGVELPPGVAVATTTPTATTPSTTTP